MVLAALDATDRKRSLISCALALEAEAKAKAAARDVKAVLILDGNMVDVRRRGRYQVMKSSKQSQPITDI